MSVLFLMSALGAAAPATPIDSVVVYPDRAQVTRVTTLDCGTRRTVTFSGITAAAAEDSFRAQLEGGSIEALRVERSVRADALTPQFNELRAKLRALDAEQEALNDELARARSKAEVGRHFEQIASAQVQREMALEKPDVKAWSQAFDVALQSHVQGELAQTELATKQRDLSNRRSVTQRKLDALGYAARREEYSAEVVASCPAGRSARLELTYLVGGASWSASYEAHADEAANSVELTTFATVKQATGEAWEATKLTLSTAIPAQNATPPELKRLQVSAVEQPPEKKGLVRRDERVAQADGASSVASTGDGRIRLSAQGLSVQLAVPDRSSVAGDGTEHRLFVARTKMKASFAMRSAPREQPFVFRVADLTNQAPFPLLPGPVSVFRSAGLIARYAMPRVAEGAVFHLTFGIEDSLRVKRVVVTELKRDAGLFNSKKRFNYDYRFELSNWGKGAADIELWETLPVSEVDDVAVTVAEQTTAGYALDRSDGIAKWKVKLAAKEQRKVELAYKVDVPSSYETGGL